MNVYRYFACVGLLLSAGACSFLNPTQETQQLDVHLQNGFRQMPVKIYIDGVLVFDDIVDEDDYAYATTFQTEVREGRHEVRVYADDAAMEERIWVREDLWVGIRYSAEQASFTFWTQDEPFRYF